MPEEDQPLQEENPDMKVKHGRKRGSFISWISKPNSLISILLLVVAVVMFVRMETEVTKLKVRLSHLEARSEERRETQVESGEDSDPKTAKQVIIDDRDSEINNDTGNAEEILGKDLAELSTRVEDLKGQIQGLDTKFENMNSKFGDLNSNPEDPDSKLKDRFVVLETQVRNITGRLSVLEMELNRKTTRPSTATTATPTNIMTPASVSEVRFRVENCEENVVRSNYTCGETEDENGSGVTKYRVITAARRGQNEKIHVRCCDVRIITS